jgi:flagellar basal-body rod protein FlgF
MRARMESLDMLANNLANSSTAGYKSDREFYSLYAASEALDPALSGETGMPATLPVVQRQWTDFSQGIMTPTGGPLDVALSGQGFFAVNGPSGVLYTRNGSFHLAQDGTLATQEGYAVRDVNGAPIVLQGTGQIEIANDGSITQDGAVVGQLAVVSCGQPAALDKAGANYFRLNGPDTAMSPATGTGVNQGKLESSNVTPAESAVRLVSLMRQFEMLQKAAQISSDMGKLAIEEVAKV